MNIRLFLLLLCMVPGAVSAASRGDSARVGVNRVSNAAARMPAVPTLSAYLSGANVSVDVDKPADKTEPDDDKPLLTVLLGLAIAVPVGFMIESLVRSLWVS